METSKNVIARATSRSNLLKINTMNCFLLRSLQSQWRRNRIF